MGAHGGARKVPAHGTSNGTSCVNLRQTSPNTPLQSDNIQGAFAPRMLPLSGDSLGHRGSCLPPAARDSHFLFRRPFPRRPHQGYSSQDVAMLRTIEAVVAPDGSIKPLEAVELSPGQRALVTLLPADRSASETAVLSEQALSDWLRREEDAAWSHFQPAQS